jgi:hypothetical protein
MNITNSPLYCYETLDQSFYDKWELEKALDQIKEIEPEDCEEDIEDFGSIPLLPIDFIDRYSYRACPEISHVLFP